MPSYICGNNIKPRKGSNKANNVFYLYVFVCVCVCVYNRVNYVKITQLLVLLFCVYDFIQLQ